MPKKRLSFIALAKRVLTEEQRPLSPVEIWEIAQKRGYDIEVGSKGKTPHRSIEAQIYTDIRNHSARTQFEKAGEGPVRFSLKQITPVGAANSSNVDSVLEYPIVHMYLERDLHPFLTSFVSYRMQVYAKTINHTKSSKSQWGEWVHPDIVGCYFPLEDWREEVFGLSSISGNASFRLYSFEIKQELNFSNLRESFFQTVSNSSWANEGYLAAARIATDVDFRGELRRLSTSFGIGVISLDVYDPDASEVLFPAFRRDVVDWETVNKLASLNPDFSEFLKRIKNDVQTKDIRKEWFDKGYQPGEDLLASLRKR